MMPKNYMRFMVDTVTRIRVVFETMKYDDLIKFYGNQSVAGKAIGLSQTPVSRWHVAGAIPFWAQCQYQVITKGALRADMKDDPRRKAA